MTAEKDYTFLQAKVTTAEREEIEKYLFDLGIKNKSEWMRELMLKEVRSNHVESEPIQGDNELPRSEESTGLDLF